MVKITFPENIKFTGTRYGLTFTEGIAELESNPFIIKYLRAKGFTITTEEAPVKKYNKLKKEDLINLLKERDIDFDLDSKNKELIELLNEFDMGSE
jgi:hypothetical protein